MRTRGSAERTFPILDVPYTLTGPSLRRQAIFVAQNDHHRIRVIDPVAGTIRTIAGTRGMAGDTGDHGPGTAALLDRPWYAASFGAGHVAFLQSSQRVVRAVW